MVSGWNHAGSSLYNYQTSVADGRGKERKKKRFKKIHDEIFRFIFCTRIKCGCGTIIIYNAIQTPLRAKTSFHRKMII